MLSETGQTPSRILIQDVRRRWTAGGIRSRRSWATAFASLGTIRDGHEVLGATVRYKAPAATRWKEAPLHAVGNDLFEGSFQPDSWDVVLSDRGLGRPGCVEQQWESAARSMRLR